MYTHARDKRLAIENHGRSTEQARRHCHAAAAEMDLALTQPLPGSINYVLAEIWQLLPRLANSRTSWRLFPSDGQAGSCAGVLNDTSQKSASRRSPRSRFWINFRIAENYRPI
jgi:hypothetical protein